MPWLGREAFTAKKCCDRSIDWRREQTLARDWGAPAPSPERDAPPPSPESAAGPPSSAAFTADITAHSNLSSLYATSMVAVSSPVFAYLFCPGHGSGHRRADGCIKERRWIWTLCVRVKPSRILPDPTRFGLSSRARHGVQNVSKGGQGGDSEEGFAGRPLLKK